jgi:hypothetical protein
LKEFQQKGLGVFAISYDSVAILADFGKRRNITFPLLSDPKSQTIRAFGVLNTYVPVGHMWYGVPFPGTFIVDRDGIVRSKYFEAIYQDRYSAPTILFRQFGSAAGTRETNVKTNHLELKYYSTRDVVGPGLRITLVADLELKPKMHVYAPGVKGYIPIQFELEASPHYVTYPVAYPKSEPLHLAPINETVSVYQGRFQITQDLRMGRTSALHQFLDSGEELKIKGNLRYQACDDKECYLPQNLPLEWALKVKQHDQERVPEPIQHKQAPASGAE